MKFSVALLQILPRENNREKNLEIGLEYSGRAKEMGADLVLFPELWNIGFASCPVDPEGRKKWEESAIDQGDQFFQEFVRHAKKLNINIAVTYLEKYGKKPRNSVSIIDRKGNIKLHYSKVFICDFGREEITQESPNYKEIGCDYNCAAGSEFPVCVLTGKEGDVSVGAMICADREFPEAATQLMRNGAELIVVPNACDWNGIRDSLLRARAFENLAGIAMANYPSPKENGNSRAYDCAAWTADGVSKDTLITAGGEEEGIFIANFDLDRIREFRKLESWRMEYRRKWYKTR